MLKKMRDYGYIDKASFNAAKLEVPKTLPPKRASRKAPYFIDYLQRSWKNAIGETDLGPLRIYSGIDMEYQRCAEQAVENGAAALEKSHPKLKRRKEPVQSALIAVSPASGAILAWVGGRSYASNQFDRVSQAKRQPGSAFKPFVYLTALDRHLNNYRTARTTSLLVDEPLTLKVNDDTWQPQNYDEEYRGEVTVREALTYSLNVPTVDLALKVGIDSIADTAELFGFGHGLPRVPSLALGAGEVSPLELARAYTALANGGRLITLRPIVAIASEEDRHSTVQARLRELRVASEGSVYVLTNMLQSVIEEGTGKVVRRMGYSAPAAGKTGTSNDARDAWFAGYTPRVLAVVWTGYDSNKSLGLTGSSAAAPIWTRFMKCIDGMEPTLDFIIPPDVKVKDIDLETGLLATRSCPRRNVVKEVYVEGTEPLTACTKHSGAGKRRYNPTPRRSPRVDRQQGQGDFFDNLWRRLWTTNNS